MGSELHRQEIINTQEAKGMRTQLSAKGTQIRAANLPVRYQFQLGERRLAPVGRFESEPEYRQLKAEAQEPGSQGRRTHLQQADIQPADPVGILQTLRLPSDFIGMTDTGWSPPDCSLAVGPEHLFVTVNAACAVFDKGGRQLLFSELADWFAPVIKQVDIHNPKALYDQQRGCWVMTACARSGDRSGSWFLLAVSHTADPLGNWWIWALDAGLDGALKTNHWADNLGLAADNSALYLTANMFDDEGKFAYSKVRILNKREVQSGGILHGWDFWNLRNPNGSAVFGLQPANNLSQSDAQFLVNASTDGHSLTLWSIVEPLRQPVLTRRQVAATAYRMAPNAFLPDQGQEIETGDTRLGNVVYRNGSLWTAHTVAANWGGKTANVSAIHWFQINPYTASVTQQGTFGSPHHHYFCPAVMVDRLNRMMLVFNRAGEREYPAIRFTGRRANDKVNLLQPSSLLKQSPVPGGKVWSACSGASIDPSGADFWIIGQYSTADNEWATWIGETTYVPRAPGLRAPSQRVKSRRSRHAYA